MLAWTAMGVTLAIKKGQLGSEIDWIGATFSISSDAVEGRIMESRLVELRLMALAIPRHWLLACGVGVACPLGRLALKREKQRLHAHLPLLDFSVIDEFEKLSSAK